MNTWLLGVNYTSNAAISLNSTLQWSRARNFNDFTANGMPFGASFNRVDVTTGLKWSLTEDASVGTDYAFYSYLPSSLSEIGGYHAHVIWFEVSQKF